MSALAFAYVVPLLLLERQEAYSPILAAGKPFRLHGGRESLGRLTLPCRRAGNCVPWGASPFQGGGFDPHNCGKRNDQPSGLGSGKEPVGDDRVKGFGCACPWCGSAERVTLFVLDSASRRFSHRCKNCGIPSPLAAWTVAPVRSNRPTKVAA
jgi:hypothetical protein